MSTFNEASHPKARKDYRCEWCSETIPKGEQHKHYVGLWEGDFQNWRMHDDCYEAAGENGYLDEGFMPGEHPRPASNVPAERYQE